MLLESRYQRYLIEKIKHDYPGAVVLKNDSAYIQGIPDWLVLYGPNWVALEIKRHRSARVRPNQEHYVNLLNDMSFSAFVFPENEKEVMREVQRTLWAER